MTHTPHSEVTGSSVAADRMSRGARREHDSYSYLFPRVNYQPLVALVVASSFAQWLRHPPRERKIPGLIPACDGVDLKIGAWHYRVSARTGWPDVSIL